MRKSMKVAGLVAALGAAATLLPGCKGSNKEAAPPPAAAAAPAAPPKEQDIDAMHAAAAAKPPGLDEHTRQVFAYPVTWKKVEAYSAALKDILAAGAKDKELMNQLREPASPSETPEQMTDRVAGIGPIRGILAKRGLQPLELLLIPRAVMAGRNAYASEKAGKPVPPDQTSASALELHRADYARIDKHYNEFMADQRALSGR